MRDFHTRLSAKIQTELQNIDLEGCDISIHAFSF